MTDEQAVRFERAARMFQERVDAITPGQWTESTPCSEWNVRDLVNHVAGEMLWAGPLLEGRTIAEVGDRFDGDQLGDDPQQAFRAATDGAVAAFTAPGALDGQVHLSYGDESARGYCDQMTLDALIHGWDLAKACGADTALPADLVHLGLRAVEPMKDMLAASGLFGTAVVLPSDAPEQDRLLAMLGRTP